jgi:hypothetical protein
MKSIKKTLFILAVVLCTGAYTSNAQIEVRVRPPRPHVVRVEAPSRHHVWIDEEWEPRGGTYVFAGGHWAEPPHPGGRWAPGHWRHGHHGEVWVPGHWR